MEKCAKQMMIAIFFLAIQSNQHSIDSFFFMDKSLVMIGSMNIIINFVIILPISIRCTECFKADGNDGCDAKVTRTIHIILFIMSNFHIYLLCMHEYPIVSLQTIL